MNHTVGADVRRQSAYIASGRDAVLGVPNLFAESRDGEDAIPTGCVSAAVLV